MYTAFVPGFFLLSVLVLFKKIKNKKKCLWTLFHNSQYLHIKKFTVQMVTRWRLALVSVKYQCTLMELGVNELC